MEGGVNESNGMHIGCIGTANDTNASAYISRSVKENTSFEMKDLAYRCPECYHKQLVPFNDSRTKTSTVFPEAALTKEGSHT